MVNSSFGVRSCLVGIFQTVNSSFGVPKEELTVTGRSNLTIRQKNARPTKRASLPLEQSAIYNMAACEEGRNPKASSSTEPPTNGQETEALEALLSLGTGESFFCLVCKARVSTRHQVKYKHDLKIKQCDAASRAMVKVGRRHCRKNHNDTWMWNLVPECGALTMEDPAILYNEAPLDSLLHQALKTAATQTALPVTKDIVELITGFSDRMTYAKCWLRFCLKKNPILKKQKDHRKLRDRAVERIDEIHTAARKYMRTKEFQQAIDSYETENVINFLQLFCVEVGRYRRCRVFLEPSLHNKYKLLPERE
jgi:hypothetical protein